MSCTSVYVMINHGIVCELAICQALYCVLFLFTGAYPSAGGGNGRPGFWTGAVCVCACVRACVHALQGCGGVDVIDNHYACTESGNVDLLGD